MALSSIGSFHGDLSRRDRHHPRAPARSLCPCRELHQRSGRLLVATNKRETWGHREGDVKAAPVHPQGPCLAHPSTDAWGSLNEFHHQFHCVRGCGVATESAAGAVRMGPYQLLWRRAATLCIESCRHLTPLFHASLVCGVQTCCPINGEYLSTGQLLHTDMPLSCLHFVSKSDIDGSRSSSGSRSRTSKLGLSDDCTFSIIVPFLFDGRGWIRSSPAERELEEQDRAGRGDFLNRGA